MKKNAGFRVERKCFLIKPARPRRPATLRKSTSQSDLCSEDAPRQNMTTWERSHITGEECSMGNTFSNQACSTKIPGNISLRAGDVTPSPATPHTRKDASPAADLSGLFVAAYAAVEEAFMPPTLNSARHRRNCSSSFSVHRTEKATRACVRGGHEYMAVPVLRQMVTAAQKSVFAERLRQYKCIFQSSFCG